MAILLAVLMVAAFAVPAMGAGSVGSYLGGDGWNGSIDGFSNLFYAGGAVEGDETNDAYSVVKLQFSDNNPGATYAIVTFDSGATWEWDAEDGYSTNSGNNTHAFVVVYPYEWGRPIRYSGNGDINDAGLLGTDYESYVLGNIGNWNVSGYKQGGGGGGAGFNGSVALLLYKGILTEDGVDYSDVPSVFTFNIYKIVGDSEVQVNTDPLVNDGFEIKDSITGEDFYIAYPAGTTEAESAANMAAVLGDYVVREENIPGAWEAVVGALYFSIVEDTDNILPGAIKAVFAETDTDYDDDAFINTPALGDLEVSLEVLKQDFHNVYKQDYHDVYKQDFHKEFTQDFHDLYKQNFRYVYKQDFHLIYKQDFHNILKQDFHNVLKQDYHFSFIPVFIKDVSSVGGTLVTWLDGGEVPGGKFGNYMTWLEVDVAKASEPDGITYTIADSSPSNNPIDYTYNIKIDDGKLSLSLDDRLISASVTAKLYSDIPEKHDPSGHTNLSNGQELVVSLPTASTPGNAAPTANATKNGNDVTIKVGSATWVEQFEKNAKKTYTNGDYEVVVEYNGNGVKSATVTAWPAPAAGEEAETVYMFVHFEGLKWYTTGTYRFVTWEEYEKILDDDPYFFEKVLDGNPYFYEKVNDGQPYLAGVAKDGAPYFFAKVNDGKPIFVEKVKDGRPHFSAKVPDGKEYFFDKVSDGEAYLDQKVKDGAPYPFTDFGEVYTVKVYNDSDELVGTPATLDKDNLSALFEGLKVGNYTVILLDADGIELDRATVTVVVDPMATHKFTVTIDGEQGKDVTIDGVQGDDETIDGDRGKNVINDGVKGLDEIIDGRRLTSIIIPGVQGENETIDVRQHRNVTIDGEQGADKIIDGDKGDDVYIGTDDPDDPDNELLGKYTPPKVW